MRSPASTMATTTRHRSSASAVVAALPRSPHGHYVAGLIARAANSRRTPRRHFSACSTSIPKMSAARIQLAQIHTAERRYAEAAALFEAALSREPFNATAAYGLATALVRGGSGRWRSGDGALSGASRQSRGRHLLGQLPRTGPIRRGARVHRARSRAGRSTRPTSRFVDATASLFGEDDPRGRVTLFDADRDGDLDAVLASSSGLTLLINDEGRFARRRTIDASMSDGARRRRAATTTTTDGRISSSLGTCGESSISPAARWVLHGSAGERRGARLRPATTATAAFARHRSRRRSRSLSLIAEPGAAQQRQRHLQRYGRHTGLTGTRRSPRSSRPTTTIAATSTCFSSRRAVRLRCSPTAATARSSTLRRQTGLPGDAAYTAAATGDLNKDGASDFVLRDVERARRSSQRAQGAVDFRSPPLRTAPAGATAMQLFDYDNDGLARSAGVDARRCAALAVSRIVVVRRHVGGAAGAGFGAG